MNEDEIEMLKRRSKEKGLDLSEEVLRTTLKQIIDSTEGLTITERIKKLHKMLEEDSKNERFRTSHKRDNR